ncbi:SDR family NAD(P)-dependent oxidoreductase [Pseudomonas poae]|uniref:SDR family NAD(P)-dependent oxidoreductase n=1 Tax=Pseudomonas poae TaxID=200451 RepID=UPI001473A20B|nr:SDR family oxidoreductase [Pseudomonas poae]NMZ50367.1 SDR family oxidoreductase [Pseudomonas poae]
MTDAVSDAFHARHDGAPSSAKGTIIVSGGSQGLGLTTVRCFLDAGYNVATFSRRKSEGIRQMSERADFHWQALDCTDYSALTAFVQHVEKRFGGIDGLVNNAATGVEGILSTMRVADIDNALDINLKGQLYLTKLVTTKLLKRGAGSVVNVSSINALRGHSGLTVYSATKAAMDGLTRSLAKELGPRGIRVNSVSPGYFSSDMVKDLSAETLGRITRRTPLGRLGTQQEVADLILYLVDRGTFVTGQNIAVDGGFTC